MKKQDKRKYDAVIVGAAFAGLATAGKIKAGRTLLIDARPIGSGVKSACGTVLDVVLELGLEDCVRQRHENFIFHLGKKVFTFPLSSPFCVIDGEKFCQRLLGEGKAEFLQAKALNFDGRVLITDQGDIQAKVFVDASGPSAVLSGAKKKKYSSFGLETIVDYQKKDLHFWYEPKVLPKGVFWIFPQGDTSRIGIASYLGRTDLLPGLEDFLKRFDLKLNKETLHGGYFAHRIREPVSRGVFRVGDAAGQCLPVTGEGIRPAVFFGQKLGEIITLILEGKITREQGIKKYRDFVFANRRKFKYETLFWAQKLLTNIPQIFVSLAAGAFTKDRVNEVVLNKYLRILK